MDKELLERYRMALESVSLVLENLYPDALIKAQVARDISNKALEKQ